jgi:hypothetical protein
MALRKVSPVGRQQQAKFHMAPSFADLQEVRRCGPAEVVHIFRAV